MPSLRRVVASLPVVGRAVTRAYAMWSRAQFPGSSNYWEKRYTHGGTSGPGSVGELARFKADVVNGFVADQRITSVVELGCGDGRQLALARYPSYLGLDVAPKAVGLCRERFADDPNKTFALYDPYAFDPVRTGKRDLALSLDVIFHLVEDDIYDLYMTHLFGLGERFVVIYSSNTDDNPRRLGHIRHRRFTPWVAVNAPAWRLVHHVPNENPFAGDDERGSWADFFVYRRDGYEAET